MIDVSKRALKMDHPTLPQLLAGDIEDSARYARSLPDTERSRLLTRMARNRPSLIGALERVKSLRITQAALSGFKSGGMPLAVGNTLIASTLANTADANPEIRRAAYDVLALIVIKTNGLSQEHRGLARNRFAEAARDSDQYTKAFAREVLGEHGILGGPNPATSRAEREAAEGGDEAPITGSGDIRPRDPNAAERAGQTSAIGRKNPR